MHTSTIIDTLRQYEGELRAAGVEHLSLFGSRARGTAVPALSDIDLIADFDPRREYSLLDRVRLENRLADMLGAKVDLAPARALKEHPRTCSSRGSSCLLAISAEPFGTSRMRSH
jgi:uncharacterized protein